MGSFVLQISNKIKIGFYFIHNFDGNWIWILVITMSTGPPAQDQ
jgi:hypothetical protein